MYFLSAVSPTRTNYDNWVDKLSGEVFQKYSLNATLIDDRWKVRTYGDLSWKGSPMAILDPEKVVVKNAFQSDVGSDLFKFKDAARVGFHEQSLDIASQAQKSKNPRHSYPGLQSLQEKIDKVQHIRNLVSLDTINRETVRQRRQYQDKSGQVRSMKGNCEKYGWDYWKDGKTTLKDKELRHNEAHLLTNILDVQYVSFLPENGRAGHCNFLVALALKDKINEAKRNILGEESQEKFNHIVKNEEEKLKLLYQRIQYYQTEIKKLDNEEYLKSKLKEYFENKGVNDKFDYENAYNLAIYKDKLCSEYRKNMESDQYMLRKKLSSCDLSFDLSALQDFDSFLSENKDKIKQYVRTDLATEVRLSLYKPKCFFPDASELISDISSEDEQKRKQEAIEYFQHPREVKGGLFSLSKYTVYEPKPAELLHLLLKQYPIEGIKEIYGDNWFELLKQCDHSLLKKFLFSGIFNESYQELTEKLTSVIGFSIVNKDGNSALMLAINYGLTDIAASFIYNESINLNITNKNDRTALMLAIEKGQIAIAKNLVEKGAIIDENVRRLVIGNFITSYKEGENIGNALDLIAFFIDKDTEFKLTELLHSAGISLDKMLFLTSVYCDNKNIAEILIEKDANVNCRGQYNNTPLIAAIKMGNTEIAKLLIEQGADLTLRDADGANPLLLAAQYNNTEIFKLLLDKSDVNGICCNVRGWNSLLLAIKNGNKEMLDMLLSLDEDRFYTEKEIQDMLLSEGEVGTTTSNRLDFINGAGINPLLLAVSKNNKHAAVKLIDAGADVKRTDVNGDNVLTLSIKNGMTDLAINLINQLTDIFTNQEEFFTIFHTNANKENALSLAIQNDQTEIVEKLIEAGADIDATNNIDTNCLMAASRLDNLEIFNMIMQSGKGVGVFQRDVTPVTDDESIEPDASCYPYSPCCRSLYSTIPSP